MRIDVDAVLGYHVPACASCPRMPMPLPSGERARLVPRGLGWDRRFGEMVDAVGGSHISASVNRVHAIHAIDL